MCPIVQVYVVQCVQVCCPVCPGVLSSVSRYVVKCVQVYDVHCVHVCCPVCPGICCPVCPGVLSSVSRCMLSCQVCPGVLWPHHVSVCEGKVRGTTSMGRECVASYHIMSSVQCVIAGYVKELTLINIICILQLQIILLFILTATSIFIN